MKVIACIFVKNRNELDELMRYMDEAGDIKWMSEHRPSGLNKVFKPSDYPFYIRINMCHGNQKRLTWSSYVPDGCPVFDAFKYIDILKGDKI